MHRMPHLSLLFVLAFSVSVSYGSNEIATLKFESQPGIIHPILTKALQLRCSVQNNNWKSQKDLTTATFLQHLTFQQPLWNDTVESSDASSVEISTSQGQAEFSRLLTLVITKLYKETGANETIASVTGCDSPILETKFVGTVSVKGSTEGSPGDGEQGYLTLTWDRPVDKNAGYFTCEAYALNSNKHPVSLSASLKISAVEPKISDLVNYISANDKYITDMKDKFTEMYVENKKLKEQTKVIALQNEQILNKLDELKGQNSQSGRIQCSYQTTVYFDPPFNSTPKVIVSLASMYFSYGNSYSWSVQSVNNASFVANCNSPSGSSQLDWLAVDF